MGVREPLTEGTIITMPNKGQYVIESLIGQGGLSLVYSAKTKNNGFPVIVKELFPAQNARRAFRTIKTSDGTIIEKKGRVYPEEGFSERFTRCFKAFEQEGQLGSSARLNSFQVISFSDCGDGYAILPRWSQNTCSFEELERSWHRAAPEKIDPVFADLGRIRFALTAIHSLLSALSSLHKENVLHLDISPSNVVWSGHRTTPTGVSFLTDLGCSVKKKKDNLFPVKNVLSYSEEFAAPEYKIKDSGLDFSSDLYAVGKLLIFLSCGRRAFDLHTDLVSEINRLKISGRHQKELLKLTQKATAYDPANRFQSAPEMAAAVEDLLDMIPLHPINEDSSAEFTLFSLKSMLEGSLDTHYSWAHELCDRRNITMDFPKWILEPISSEHHVNVKEFFECIMPRYISLFFAKNLESESVSMSDIMSCNYPRTWKNQLIPLIKAYGPVELIDRCEAFLSNKNLYLLQKDFLFTILGGSLRRFYNRCNIGENAHVGLAIIALYALLGENSFTEMFNGDDSQCATFFGLGHNI